MCQQGNVDFVNDNDETRIKSGTELRHITSLLSLDQAELEKALCSRVVAAKGEVVAKGHTIEQAKYGRDAFAKASDWTDL